MPRSSSSSRQSSPSRPRAAHAPAPARSVVSAPQQPVPAPAAPAPAPATVQQHNVKVEQPGFFTNVWQGFGLGAGQAIAHNIFRRDPAPPAPAPSQAQVAVYSEATTHNFPKEYNQCMKDNNNDTELCKQFL